MVKTQIFVRVSDAQVSRDPSEVVVTYSLGSCIGVCLYDNATQVGGMLHFQLPDSANHGVRAKQNPGMYADPRGEASGKGCGTISRRFLRTDPLPG